MPLLHAEEVAEKVGNRLPYGRGSESARRVYGHLLSRDRQGAVVLLFFQQPLKCAPQVSGCLLQKPCQRQIESSYCLPIRKFRCGGANGREEVRVDQFARGRALADAQGRGDDGAGSEESIGAKTLCGRRRRAAPEGLVLEHPPESPFLG